MMIAQTIKTMLVTAPRFSLEENTFKIYISVEQISGKDYPPTIPFPISTSGISATCKTVYPVGRLSETEELSLIAKT